METQKPNAIGWRYVIEVEFHVEQNKIATYCILKSTFIMTHKYICIKIQSFVEREREQAL